MAASTCPATAGDRPFVPASRGDRLPKSLEGSLPRFAHSAAILCAVVLAGTATGASAQPDEEQPDIPDFPTTEFADGAKGATVTSGGVRASISMVLRKEADPDFDVPLLSVTVDDKRVLEAVGVASGLDIPATEASIAEIDPDNKYPEVYFASFSGGAHCCTTVIVGDEVDGKWVAVPVGEFDGDGNYLDDVDGDGKAEIVTVDNRFLYKFDCYACSAAPLTIHTVRDGKVVDVSTEPRFLPAHREWLAQVAEGVDPAERWKSPGFLAGWVAAKVRVGEGADAFASLVEHWDATSDAGEDVCTTGGEIEECGRQNVAHLKFPERLKLFLDQTGYRF
jgi:hypothetical protein